MGAALRETANKKQCTQMRYRNEIVHLYEQEYIAPVGGTKFIQFCANTFRTRFKSCMTSSHTGFICML